MEKHKIIMDVDTGTDDALALILAYKSESIDLLGVTTVAGNRPVAQTTDNTLRVLDMMGAHVPVYRGCEEPLCSELFGDRHSPSRAVALSVIVDGQRVAYHSETLPYSEPTSKEQDICAVEYLIRTFMHTEEKISLVCVGPLTNIATAMRAQPRIKEKIQRIVIMGGGIASGNMTGAAELNFWMDPEAAQIVLTSGCDLQLVPLDATHAATLTSEDAERIRSIGIREADMAAGLIMTSIRAYAAMQHMENEAPLHDALAVASVIDPNVLRDVRRVRIDVDIGGGICDGMSVIDSRPHSGKKPNATIAMSADRIAFANLLWSQLGGSVGKR